MYKQQYNYNSKHWKRLAVAEEVKGCQNFTCKIKTLWKSDFRQGNVWGIRFTQTGTSEVNVTE